MKEFDQYRIELSGEEAEEIIKEHMAKMLQDKGYTLDYSGKSEGEFFPDTFWRGVKTPNVELSGGASAPSA